MPELIRQTDNSATFKFDKQDMKASALRLDETMTLKEMREHLRAMPPSLEVTIGHGVGQNLNAVAKIIRTEGIDAQRPIRIL